MAFNIPSICLVIGLLTSSALAACSSYGVDYVNGGSYDIDTTSNDKFTFTTIFQGCDQESVKPVLVDPSNGQHPCSAINTTPAGEQVTSTCELELSAMTSGLYKIIIQGSKIGVQRTIALTVGTPQTTIITATPTVIVGVTSTPNATTVYSTISKTQTTALPPATVTAHCGGVTQTVTITPKPSTITSTSWVTRTVTDKKATSFTTTTVTKTASCHYLTTKSFTVPDPQPTICIGLACLPGHGGSPALPDKALETEKFNIAAVPATTVTFTETTYTVTITTTTIVPAGTTTEDVYQTVTSTITPTPSTVCDGATTTVSITNPAGIVTQTDISYSTSHVVATVWVEETKYSTSTNKASATSCLMNGGWYGADAITATASS
ncbi:hypothetical protein GGR54DRAFT_654590 [Hypoxylon sp. NC1633]|nr:hypothetical protein GGR54DRAFT_654590 [Hypoxylon sp. NC1633]